MTEQALSVAKNMLDAALGYAREFAWSVFPVCTPLVDGSKQARCLQHRACQHPGKTPLVKWGAYQDEQATEGELRAWWQHWPTANIGMATGATSEVAVVDLDGELALAEAERRGYDPGPWVRTGRVGGRHLYFRHRPDAPTIFAKRGGIDFRGQGGYVLLPPSLHKTGTRYSWGEPVRRGEPLPVLPSWIDELASSTDGGHANGRVDFGSLLRDGIDEGQRDQELFRAASKLRGADVPYDLAVRLIQWAAEQCHPAFDPAEAKAKVESAYGRYSPNGVVCSPVRIIGGADLAAATFEPVRWAIPGILPSGLTILAGRPKLGKSWLVLGWVLDVALGSPVLHKIVVEPGQTLYLALEDSERRLQDRQARLLGDRQPSNDFMTTTSWPRMGEGGMEELAVWVDAHPRARLIVIDTFKKFRPKEQKQHRLYDLDYDAIAPLAELAAARNIAIVLVFHTNKQDPSDPIDLVSGTLGLSGAADGVLVLKRERGQADASLFVTGRDVEEQDLALKKEDAQDWWLLGQATDFRRSKERQQILQAVGVMPGMTPTEIATATQRKIGAVKYLLFAMVRDEEIRNRDGHYYLLGTTPNSPISPTNPAPSLSLSPDSTDSLDSPNSTDRGDRGGVQTAQPDSTVRTDRGVSANRSVSDDSEPTLHYCRVCRSRLFPDEQELCERCDNAR